MKFIKVIFGLFCFFIVLFSAYSGISDFVGDFIKEKELKEIVSGFSLLLVGWGFYQLETDWRHYK